MYQVENIPSAYFQKDVNFSSSSSTKEKSQDAYWEKALKGFSINKHLLSVHGNSVNKETIVALRLVEDHLFKVGGPTKVKITAKLLVSEKFIPKI